VRSSRRVAEAGRNRWQLVARGLALSLVAALLVLLGLRLMSSGQGRALDEALAAGRPVAAPDFSLDRLDRPGRLTLRSLRGKTVVLNFWASWCVPCKQEAPLLGAAAKRYRDAGVVVVGVDAQDFRSDARRFIRHYGLTYPVVRDSGGTTVGRYGVDGFPETWFVDAGGRLVGEHVKGPLAPKQLDRDIQAALAR